MSEANSAYDWSMVLVSRALLLASLKYNDTARE